MIALTILARILPGPAKIVLANLIAVLKTVDYFLSTVEDSIQGGQFPD
jgi:hypothetical protein